MMPTALTFLQSLLTAAAAWAGAKIHLPPAGAAVVVLLGAFLVAAVGGRLIGLVVRLAIIAAGVLVSAKLAGVI
jgi:hypothetical protein